MRKGKVLISGEKLKKAIADSDYTQKQIDEYFGFVAGMKNYIARGEIPISIRDSLEHKFGIKYADYMLLSVQSGCKCCDENNFKLLCWSYCPICGKKL